jgi:pimeloyl-ACP methyl ester carboxylesterase
MAGKLIQGAPVAIQRFDNKKGGGADQAILLLHGFPGEVNQQNQDIAAFLADELNAPAFVLHYRGLGLGRDKFSFKSSIEDAVTAARFLIEVCGYNRLKLVGHSWGGLAALNVLRHLGSKIDQVALLSPLTTMISAEAARHIIVQFQAERLGFFAAESVDQVLAEIEQIREEQEPIGFVQTLDLRDGQLLVVQAAHDLEVPPQVNRDFVAIAGEKARYLEVSQGHTFLEDRQLIFQLILEHFRSGFGGHPC